VTEKELLINNYLADRSLAGGILNCKSLLNYLLKLRLSSIRICFNEILSNRNFFSFLLLQKQKKSKKLLDFIMNVTQHEKKYTHKMEKKNNR